MVVFCYFLGKKDTTRARLNATMEEESMMMDKREDVKNFLEDILVTQRELYRETPLLLKNQMATHVHFNGVLLNEVKLVEARNDKITLSFLLYKPSSDHLILEQVLVHDETVSTGGQFIIYKRMWRFNRDELGSVSILFHDDVKETVNAFWRDFRTYTGYEFDEFSHYSPVPINEEKRYTIVGIGSPANGEAEYEERYLHFWTWTSAASQSWQLVQLHTRRLLCLRDMYRWLVVQVVFSLQFGGSVEEHH